MKFRQDPKCSCVLSLEFSKGSKLPSPSHQGAPDMGAEAEDGAIAQFKLGRSRQGGGIGGELPHRACWGRAHACMHGMPVLWGGSTMQHPTSEPWESWHTAMTQHRQGGTLPQPTLGPPTTSHHMVLRTPLARGPQHCLTLLRVPQSEQPVHRHPTAVMWAAASSTCRKEKTAGGQRGATCSPASSLPHRHMRKDALQTVVLTMMPPPQTPGMALACLLMCPSTRYFDAPLGRSRRMLAATESVPRASRQGPTIRLHFPTHMATLHRYEEKEEERKELSSAP